MSSPWNGFILQRQMVLFQNRLTSEVVKLHLSHFFFLSNHRGLFSRMNLSPVCVLLKP